MPPIVIVTDSASDIDQSLQQTLGIEVVPLKVSFGEETYLDGVTLRADQFYEKLAQSPVLPTTSQPSPMEFAAKYKEIIAGHGRDVQIIVLTLSAALSGTHQSAVIAKTMLEEAADITVIDSKKASFVYGLIVVEAARAARAGQSKQQVLDLINRYIEAIQVYFLIDTLEYLQKGGRIGKASAFLGSLLNIKPILYLDERGVVSPYEKVRGSKKAVSRMIERLKEYAGTSPVKTAIIHAQSPEEAEALRERVQTEMNVVEAFQAEVGPVIGTHTGPGVLGCAVVKV
jgi:DegV family protein with EDD domain